jgi:glycosyltransferase involved in cell wall biosynthesis
MEAMCMGTPVIGSRIRGIEDLLEDDCGFLVPKGDPSGIAQAMDHLLGDPNAAAERAGKARERMSLYDVQDILALHDELYRTVLTGSPQVG